MKMFKSLVTFTRVQMLNNYVCRNYCLPLEYTGFLLYMEKAASSASGAGIHFVKVTTIMVLFKPDEQKY